jgi:hypothetical protein
MTDFAKWECAFTGDKPPMWNDDMPWGLYPEIPFGQPLSPNWIMGTIYSVPIDAVKQRVPLDELMSDLRAYTDHELAQSGIYIFDPANDDPNYIKIKSRQRERAEIDHQNALEASK